MTLLAPGYSHQVQIHASHLYQRLWRISARAGPPQLRRNSEPTLRVRPVPGYVFENLWQIPDSVALQEPALFHPGWHLHISGEKAWEPYPGRGWPRQKSGPP